MEGVFDLSVSLVSWIVMMSAFVACMSCESSACLLLMPFILICMILRVESFGWFFGGEVWVVEDLADAGGAV